MSNKHDAAAPLQDPAPNHDPAGGGPPVVVLVGHCGFDASGLSRLVGRVCPPAVVERANTDTELARLLPRARALLVNRRLDGRFAASTGVGLIEALGAPGRPAAVLISDLPDAQRAAEQAGAAPGFGKAALGSPEAAERLAAVLGVA